MPPLSVRWCLSFLKIFLTLLVVAELERALFCEHKLLWKGFAELVRKFADGFIQCNPLTLVELCEVLLRQIDERGEHKARRSGSGVEKRFLMVVLMLGFAASCVRSKTANRRPRL